MHILHVVGARPNLMKVAPVLDCEGLAVRGDRLNRRGVEQLQLSWQLGKGISQLRR